MAAAAPLENDLKLAGTALATLLVPAMAAAELHLLIVEGMAGEAVYETQFDSQVNAIYAAAQSVTDDDHIHVLRTADAGRDAVLGRLAAIREAVSADDQFALFLIGHGSYDEYEYKFNIAGPDLTGEDLAGALSEFDASNLLVVNTSSSSGATVDLLAADNRILVLATRSGAVQRAW